MENINKFWLDPEFWNQALATDKGSQIAEAVEYFFDQHLHLSVPFETLESDFFDAYKFFCEADNVAIYIVSIEEHQISEFFDVKLIERFSNIIANLFWRELMKLENVSRLTYLFGVFESVGLYGKLRKEIDTFLSKYYDPESEGYDNFVDLLSLNAYFLIAHFVYCIVKGYEDLGKAFKVLVDFLKIGNYPIGLLGGKNDLFLILTK